MVRGIQAVVTGDEPETRACKDIPEEACHAVPRSFNLNVMNGACTKLAEQLASPGLVLPWLLAVLGAPAAFAGWLVPVRQAGALLPQLFVAGYLRSFPVRKWFWFAAGILQSLLLLSMALGILRLSPGAAGVVIVAGLALFSMASGMGSVAFSDVVGKTIPKGRRGRMLAMRATFGGLLAFGAGILVKGYLGSAASALPYAVLLCVAAALWFLAAFFFAAIPEQPGAVEGGANAFRRALSGLGLLKRDRDFRRFVAARCLLLSVELAMPYSVLLVLGLEGIEKSDLGVFVIAVSLSALVSSPLWGLLADVASQRVLAASGALGALSAAALPAMAFLPGTWQSAYVCALPFVLLGLAEGGSRLGRKTYLVDMAPEGEKGTYSAVANTLAGCVMLAAGVLGFAAQALGAQVFLLILAGLMLSGAVLAWSLPSR